MEVACLLVMAGAGMLGGMPSPGLTGGPVAYDLETLSGRLPGLLQDRGGLVAIAFLLFLVGFGIKAGMWPLGRLWLPDAHPAAPSPVSAILSGVMIKTGVYGLARTFLWMVPAGSLAAFGAGAWGALLAALGTATLLIGTLQALRQDHTKRFLAFSSIGQVGYMLLGLGTCLALSVPGAESPPLLALAALGLHGALFHALNHGTFKSLLFLNAGSILRVTGTQDLDKLGGLAKVLPLTGVTALIASCSIAGVPLTNGFASKWSLYTAAVMGAPGAPYLPICGALAVLTSVLTLATFLKLFGMAFLAGGPPRDAAVGRELPLTMMGPQVILASLCIAVGLAPAVGFRAIGAALRASPGGLGGLLAGTPAVEALGGATIQAAGARSCFAPAAIAVVLCLLFFAAALLARSAGASRRRDDPWLCGYARPSEATRFRANGLYREVTRAIAWVGGDRPANGVPAGPAVAGGNGRSVDPERSGE
jgi:formate hydrogenlyase subunit 3/multisubunit Na+/H+ antiporter MnhD subunit